MQKINDKLLSWASIADEQTIEQAKLSASMPFIHPHVALMPDAHLGYGSTVGSVIPTLGVVIPSAVGVDIGCGMIGARTQFTKADVEGKDLKEMRESIERAIPMSKGNENRKIQDSAQARINLLEELALSSGVDPTWYDKMHAAWRPQLGTLGGGNHFIELCYDGEDRVWVFLHSGSRGVGKKIADHHIAAAQEYCKRHWIQLPHEELAYLVEGTKEFDAYIRDLRWAQQFAMHNRDEMMDRVVRQLGQWMGTVSVGMGGVVDSGVVEELRINTHHNYTVLEKHFGKNVWMTRKGAVHAGEGMWGLIPGSMGTRSYVVVGKGNKVALNSAPHGAGRVYSRTAARAKFKMDDLRERMKGIEFRESDSLIDEIPDAYKDIDQVMEDAKDLVEVKYVLRQFLNVKGD